MKRIAFCLLFFSALLLAGCEEKVIDIDPGVIENKVVAIAHVETDSTINLRLTRSRFFLDTRPFSEITDATVSLKVNGAATTTPVSRDGGNYAVSYVPQPGDHLELSVDVPGRETVTAETTVPATPVIGNLRRTYGVGTYGDSTTTIHFRLTDDGSQANYYGIRLRYEDTVYHSYNHNPYIDTIIMDTTVESYYLEFSCSDLLITDNTDLNYVLNDGSVSTQWLAFSDDKINGTVHEVSLTYSLYRDDYAYETYDVEKGFFDIYEYSPKRVFVEVTSYTRDRYLYEVTVSSYSDDILTSMFTEPVLVHTNVKGGIGIFAAMSRTIVEAPAE